MRELDESKCPITHSQFEKLLSSGDPLALADGLDRLVYHEPELDWAQEMCLRLIENSDYELKKAALFGLALLAKKHRRIDHKRAVPALERLKADPIMGSFPKYALAQIEKHSSSRDTIPASRKTHAK